MALTIWHLLTRLGEAQILLPATVLTLVSLVRHAEGRLLAVCWIAALGIATLLTTATKLAFIGWGWGWPGLNFTGISGHAMFAAAVYPLLLATLASRTRAGFQNVALLVGCLLALTVGVSRVVLGAHSESEVVAGLLLGALVSVLAWIRGRAAGVRMRPLIPILVMSWLVFMPAHAPASQSHQVVTQLALKLSGHSHPYTRRDMLRSVHPVHPVHMPIT